MGLLFFYKRQKGMNEMKYEWRKQEKEFYLPKQKPEIIDVPEQKFLTIKGKGNPNGPEFADRIGVLYSMAYAIRMMPKKGFMPDGYFEYTVYPLEGIWDLSEEGRKLDILDKDELVYTLMIKQPDFVTEEIVQRAYEAVSKKKPHPLLQEVSFESIQEGLCVQILHVGPYDDEWRSFELIDEFIQQHPYKRKTLQHREIYLSDFRRVEPAKLKTVLRYKLEKE